ncbi:MAG: prolipoprotein diacylglyceryl transferase [Deltaproteobacteria bacterium]|nr:prolipoprotein diacylglyceryl transferase [Deltaproteobacteria bacterium]
MDLHIPENDTACLYPVTAFVALIIALVLPSASTQIPRASRKTYAYLQACTLLGALVGAKLAMLSGDLGWPFVSIPLSVVVFSGKSLVGGLLGGFIAAEIAKPFFRWREPPNDWFATKLVLSIAIGRIGCILAGCCRGIATDLPLAFVYSDGIRRIPIAGMELVFHLVLFVFFLFLRRQIGLGLGLGRRLGVQHRAAYRLAGRLFGLYMLLYGIFRVSLEPFRETPKHLLGISVYQALAVGLTLAGLFALLRKDFNHEPIRQWSRRQA